MNLPLLVSRLSFLREQTVDLSPEQWRTQRTTFTQPTVSCFNYERLIHAVNAVLNRCTNPSLRQEFYTSSGTYVRTGKIHVSVQRRDKSLPSQRYQTALCTYGQRKENLVTLTASLQPAQRLSSDSASSSAISAPRKKPRKSTDMI